MRTWQRWAVGTAVVGSAACVVAALVLAAVVEDGWELLYVDEVVAGVVLTTVGGILGGRVPRNPVGWLLLAGGLGGAVAAVANIIVPAALAAAPGATPPVWLDLLTGAGSTLWVAPFVVLPLVLFVFPDGQLRSRPWRIPLALTATAIVVGVACAATGITMMGAQRLDGVPTPPPPVLFATVVGCLIVVLLGFVAATVHLVLRFRASRGELRQQLRWFVAAAAATGLLLLTSLLSLEGGINDLVWALTLLPLPAAVAVAVTRYRLYELDRVLARTVTYTLLSGLLAVVYLGTVAVAQLALVRGTGGPSSPFAVAAATLATVTLFAPTRSRLQTSVDRRFDRARYDAQRTLEVYRARLRDDITLDGVTADLLAAVDQTVAPAHAALWLRPRRSRS